MLILPHCLGKYFSNRKQCKLWHFERQNVYSFCNFGMLSGLEIVFLSTLRFCFHSRPFNALNRSQPRCIYKTNVYRNESLLNYSTFEMLILPINIKFLRIHLNMQLTRLRILRASQIWYHCKNVFCIGLFLIELR